MAAPRVTPAAPVQVRSAVWRIGQPVTLTLGIQPPRAAQTISLTVLTPGQVEPAFAMDLAGVQLLWLPPEYQETEIQLAAAAGARYIGLDFDWRRIQPEAGRFDWQETDRAVALAKRYELRLVPMLLYTPRWASTAAYAPLDYHRAPPLDYKLYRDFVYAVVRRYKPHGDSPLTSDGYGITDWVIWNEPNVRGEGQSPLPGGFWIGSLEQYVQLLRAGYEGAHAADPTCNVLNGGLADVYWEDGKADLITALQQLYDPNGDGNAADGARPYFDTLNIHIYPPPPPEIAWYRQRIDAILQIMQRFDDAQKTIWITETGYGSASGLASESANHPIYLDEAAQAESVHLIYSALSAYPQVQRIFWWNLRDYYSDTSATNPAMEAHHGLLRADFSPKPAYLTFAHLTGAVGQVYTTSVATDDSGTALVSMPAALTDRPGRYVVFARRTGVKAGLPFPTTVVFYRVER